MYVYDNLCDNVRQPSVSPINYLLGCDGRSGGGGGGGGGGVCVCVGGGVSLHAYKCVDWGKGGACPFSQHMQLIDI